MDSNSLSHTSWNVKTSVPIPAVAPTTLEYIQNGLEI